MEKHKRKEGVQLFVNKELELKVRAVKIDDKPYFVATDIAKALGYVNPSDAVKKHCRWVAKCEVPHPQSKNKTLEVNVIPEGDMYRLITNSELPSAENFESWVFDEVLPQIRKTGRYSTNNQLTLSEFKGQVMTLVNDIVSAKINEVEEKCSEFYKINSAKKYDVSQYIKRRLGINKANDEYHQVKDRVFLLLNVTKWEDIDIDTFKESIDIIDESIRVIKMERPYEQVRFNL